jgi:elongation factor Ts
MEISASLVKDLREKTGAGFMDCKKALVESNGELDNAIEYLRKKGLSAASKRAEKAAHEGLVSSYIHSGGKIGVLAEINCETDFVAKTDDFKHLAKDIAMQIAASNPLYVDRDDVAEAIIEKERAIFKAQALESGKPENIVDKIVDGKIEKYYSEICLMEQTFVKDPDKSVGEHVKANIAKLGENIKINRFVRYTLGT